MKHLWIYSLVSLFFAFAGFYLALKGIDDWGWFLIAAVCTFVYPTNKKENKDKDKKITFINSELWSKYSEKQAALFREIEFLQYHQNSKNLMFKERCSKITPDVLYAIVQELCEMEKDKDFYCGNLKIDN